MTYSFVTILNVAWNKHVGYYGSPPAELYMTRAAVKRLAREVDAMQISPALGDRPELGVVMFRGVTSKHLPGRGIKFALRPHTYHGLPIQYVEKLDDPPPEWPDGMPFKLWPT